MLGSDRPHFIVMEIDGHEEITGEEIDWACDTRDELTED